MKTLSDLYSTQPPCQGFNGAILFFLPDLMAAIRSRGIRLSVFSPRKLPFLCRLFNLCGGNFSEARSFSAADPTHLVLLNGLRIPAGVVVRSRSGTRRQSSRPSSAGVDQLEQDVLLQELFDILEIPSGSSDQDPVTAPAAVQSLDEVGSLGCFVRGN